MSIGFERPVTIYTCCWWSARAHKGAGCPTLSRLYAEKVHELIRECIGKEEVVGTYQVWYAPDSEGKVVAGSL